MNGAAIAAALALLGYVALVASFLALLYAFGEDQREVPA